MIETYFVDSFTTEPFKGNPAGVCLLNNEMSDEKMFFTFPPYHLGVAQFL